MKQKHIVFLETIFANLDVLRQVKEILGHRITLITTDDFSSYTNSGKNLKETNLRFVDRILQASDTSGLQPLKSLIDELHASEPIDAVITFKDLDVVAVCEIAEYLKLPHLSPKAARAARDKSLMRQIFAEHGIEQPHWHIVKTLEEARAYLGTNKYPVVAKPVDMVGSINVKLLRNDDDLINYFKGETTVQKYGKVYPVSENILLEEFIEGDLVSVETVTVDGRHYVLGLIDRLLGDFPFFVELGGSFPTKIPQAESVINMALRGLDAIGLDFGPAQIELIISAQGPKIVEINSRLAGGVVPEMIDAVTGGKIFADVVKQFLGEKISFQYQMQGVATIRALCAKSTGILQEVIKSVRHNDPGVIMYQVNATPQQSVRPPENFIDRLGFTIVLAQTLEESRQLAAQVANETVFIVNNA